MKNKTNHEQLQEIEHINKVLIEHEELVTRVVNGTEDILNNYIPILHTYVNAMTEIRKSLGNEVVNIIKSTRELKVVTTNTQNIIDFTTAVSKLNSILTPELVDKLNKVIK
jgi:prophage DNA circulation protein